MEFPLRKTSQEEAEWSALCPGRLNLRESAPCNIWIWAGLGPRVSLDAVYEKI